MPKCSQWLYWDNDIKDYSTFFLSQFNKQCKDKAILADEHADLTPGTEQWEAWALCLPLHPQSEMFPLLPTLPSSTSTPFLWDQQPCRHKGQPEW